MKILKLFFLGLILVLLFSNCNEHNQLCDLDALNLKGDVKKLENIVKTTIPLTEMFAETYDYNYVFSAYDGNFELNFDKNGNLETYMGYDLNGEFLFKSIYNDCKGEKDFYFFPCPLGFSEEKMSHITVGNVKCDSLKKVHEVEFYANGKIAYISQMHYDTNGDISFISKEYIINNENSKKSSRVAFLNANLHDTTFFHYLSYDEWNNWTEAKVEYHGTLPRHNYSYYMERQITYYNSSKPITPLISKIKEHDVPIYLSETKSIDVNEFGQLSLPIYMIEDEKIAKTIDGEYLGHKEIPLKYLCVYKYEGDDAYATFSISTLPPEYAPNYDDFTKEDLKYDSDTDDYLYEAMVESGNKIVKWLPYKFVKVDNKQALCLRYYRNGIGSPIPVYVEIYEFKANDGRKISITLSYQSNLYDKFKSDFNAIIKTLRINKLAPDTLPASDIKTNAWKKHTFFDAISISVPPTVEIRDNAGKYNESLSELNIQGNKDAIIFNQKGLNKMERQAYEKYCRIMLTIIPGEYGDFLKRNETEAFSADDVQLFHELVESELGQKSSLIGEISYKWICVNNANGILLSYKRTGTDFYANKAVDCKLLLFQDDNRMVKMILSYRDAESNLWKDDFDNVLRTFKWIN